MKCTRTFAIELDRAKGREDGGAYEFSLSSEAPVERWFGTEILSHEEDAVDLSRLADGRHPLLLNHHTDRQIGVITRAWLQDRKLRIAPRFSRSALGEEIKQDVDDDIRTLVSVGYFVHQVVEDRELPDGTHATRSFTGEEFEREMRAKHGDGFYRELGNGARKAGEKAPVYTVTRWTPFEGSVVPVPADTEVGKGRSHESDAPKPEAEKTPIIETISTEKSMSTEVVKDPNAARVADIAELGDKYSRYVSQKDVASAIRDGKSVDQFRDLIMDKMETRHTDQRDNELGLSRTEAQRYSFGKLVRALTLRAEGNARALEEVGFEIECSRAVAKILGREPEGIFLPPDVFRRDFNVGTASEAGNLVPTELRTDLWVDALRNNLVLGQMGVRILPGLTGNIDIPRKATPSTPGMLTEVGTASESAPATAKVTLVPHRIGVYTEPSKQAIIQSAIPLESMLRDDLLQGAAVLLEFQSLNGNGTAPNILGLRNTAGIGTVVAGANGATVSWGHIVDMETACANVNAEPDRLAGYIVNTRVRGRAKQVQMGTNLPFIWSPGAQPLNGYRAGVTNNLPNNLTKGTSTTVCSAALFGSDWSMAVLGLFGAPDVTVDPLTLATTGQVRITLNQFADFGVRQPACFAKIEDLLT